MFKSNMITRARAKNTPTKRKKVTKKDVEVTNTLLLPRSEPSTLLQPFISKLKVIQLKELIESEGVPMPLLGSGVNNSIVKKDMIQAVLNFYPKQIKTDDKIEPDKVNVKVVNIKKRIVQRRKNPVKSSDFSPHRHTKKAPPNMKVSQLKELIESKGVPMPLLGSGVNNNIIKKDMIQAVLNFYKNKTARIEPDKVNIRVVNRKKRIVRRRKNPVKSSANFSSHRLTKKAPPSPKEKEVHSKETGFCEVSIEFTIEMKDLRLKGKIEEFIQQYHRETGNKGNEYIVGTQIHYSVQEKGYFVCISNTEVGMDPLCWISENYDLYRPRSSFKVGNINRKEYIFARGNVVSYYDVGIHTQQEMTRANRKKKGK